jgi:hypothetical protein
MMMMMIMIIVTIIIIIVTIILIIIKSDNSLEGRKQNVCICKDMIYAYICIYIMRNVKVMMIIMSIY